MPSERPWTPGPWEWMFDGSGPCAHLMPVGKLAYVDCDPIADDGSAGGEYGQTIDHKSPNARLIAAAPELYEALERQSKAAAIVLRLDILGLDRQGDGKTLEEWEAAMGELNMATFNAQTALSKALPKEEKQNG